MSSESRKRTSPNRAYLALLRSAQIQPNGWTSDTCKMIEELEEINIGGFE